eukprot:4644342-Alexandrium_andersonii.AAC.1
MLHGSRARGTVPARGRFLAFHGGPVGGAPGAGRGALQQPGCPGSPHSGPAPDSGSSTRRFRVCDRHGASWRIRLSAGAPPPTRRAKRPNSDNG